MYIVTVRNNDVHTNRLSQQIYFIFMEGFLKKNENGSCTSVGRWFGAISGCPSTKQLLRLSRVERFAQ